MCRVLGVSVTATKNVLKTRVASALQDKSLSKKRKIEVRYRKRKGHRHRHSNKGCRWRKKTGALFFLFLIRSAFHSYLLFLLPPRCCSSRRRTHQRSPIS